MAGSLPDVPGRRFAYDLDGTLIRAKNPDLTFRELTNPQYANDEAFGDWMIVASQNQLSQRTTATIWATFVFPQLRNIAGYYAIGATHSITNTGNKRGLEWSANTTDGSDGTWTQVEATWTGVFNNFNNLAAGGETGITTGQVLPLYRTTITPLTLTGVKGVRFGFGRDATNGGDRDMVGFQTLHIYGEITGDTGGLRFWHPTIDQEVPVAQLDFGDNPQGTVITRQMRIKNTHATQTANSVLVSAAASGTSNTLLAAGLSFSSDNVTYTATLNVGNIISGAISPLVYVRRVVGAGEPPLTRSARLQAVAGSWT